MIRSTDYPGGNIGKGVTLSELARVGALSLWLPVKIESEMNKRQHWAVVAKRKKAQRTSLAMHFMPFARMVRKWPAWKVTLTRYGKRKLDSHDNLRMGFKAIADEIAAQLGVDDADPRIEWCYGQQVGKVYAVRVLIERVAKSEAGAAR